MIQNSEFNPLITWKTESGDVNLFCDQEILRFNFKTNLKLKENCFRTITGVPNKALKKKNGLSKLYLVCLRKYFRKSLDKKMELPSPNSSTIALKE